MLSMSSESTTERLCSSPAMARSKAFCFTTLLHSWYLSCASLSCGFTFTTCGDAAQSGGLARGSLCAVAHRDPLTNSVIPETIPGGAAVPCLWPGQCLGRPSRDPATLTPRFLSCTLSSSGPGDGAPAWEAQDSRLGPPKEKIQTHGKKANVDPVINESPDPRKRWVRVSTDAWRSLCSIKGDAGVCVAWSQ